MLLPDTDPEAGGGDRRAAARAKTPMGQTCSAGLACWDFTESIDDLLGRADEALYLAKASGRDQLAGRRYRRSAAVATQPVMIRRWAATEHERAVRFRTARRDPELTVVEGFHALKHALRFGAELVEAVAVDPACAGGDGGRPGARPGGPARRRGSSGRQGDACRPGAAGPAHRRRRDRPPPAGRPRRGARRPRPAPAVLLEQPRNMGNIGACIRVAAAAGAAAADHHRRERPLAPRRRPRRRRAAVRAPRRPVEVAAAERPAAAGDRPGGGGAGARAGCRRGPSSPSAPSATASAARSSSAPRRGSRSRCARASPASTSPPRSRSSSSSMRLNYGCPGQERGLASGIRTRLNPRASVPSRNRNERHCRSPTSASGNSSS